MRIIFLVFVTIIFSYSNIKLLDPVSKRIFGTFLFGEHQFLKITSINHICCGYGLDPLVYNTEFVYFDYLQHQIYKDIKPNQEIYIVSADKNINTQSTLNQQTFQRGLDQNNYFLPRYISMNQIIEMEYKPKLIYLVLYPNLPDDKTFKQLLKKYTIINKKKYSENGYSLEVNKLYLK